jgi:hypothetical protein
MKIGVDSIFVLYIIGPRFSLGVTVAPMQSSLSSVLPPEAELLSAVPTADTPFFF